jgi:pyrroline-5-carboxylate reductase
MRQSSECSGSPLTLTEAQMTEWPASLVLVGAGKMGGAMAQGWLDAGLPGTSLTIVEPNPSPEIASLTAVRGVALNSHVAAPPEMLVLAVKPQSLDQVAPQIAELAGERTLLLSIIAGKTIANLLARLPHARAVVRAMPNTPAAIGRGITVAVAADNVSADQRVVANALLRATGAVEWTDDEKLMDAVTAVSGSGPAYVFLLAEELARAGIEAGLPAELATKLARQTVAGSGELLQRSEVAAATLRQNVTSPGGTTAAALEVLMGADGMQQLLTRAVVAATQRSKELAK